MCSIGRDQSTSIGATSPSSTLLGSTAIASSANPGATRIERGRPVGTLLTGSAPTPRAPRTTRPDKPGGSAYLEP